MSKPVIVDVNVPREVCERLSEMGFETQYVTDILSEDTPDKKILDWMKQNHCVLLTKDKNFPDGGNGHKIILQSESSVKLSRESYEKLVENEVFPEPLTGSWRSS